MIRLHAIFFRYECGMTKAVFHDALQPTIDVDFWLTTIFNNVKNISCPTLFDFKMFPVKSEVFVNVSSLPKGIVLRQHLNFHFLNDLP